MTAAMMMSGAAMLHALGHSGYELLLLAPSLFFGPQYNCLFSV